MGARALPKYRCKMNSEVSDVSLEVHVYIYWMITKLGFPHRDTAGQERFETLTAQYYRRAQVKESQVVLQDCGMTLKAINATLKLCSNVYHASLVYLWCVYTCLMMCVDWCLVFNAFVTLAYVWFEGMDGEKEEWCIIKAESCAMI